MNPAEITTIVVLAYLINIGIMRWILVDDLNKAAKRQTELLERILKKLSEAPEK